MPMSEGTEKGCQGGVLKLKVISAFAMNPEICHTSLISCIFMCALGAQVCHILLIVEQGLKVHLVHLRFNSNHDLNSEALKV